MLAAAVVEIAPEIVRTRFWLITTLDPLVLPLLVMPPTINEDDTFVRSIAPLALLVAVKPLRVLPGRERDARRGARDQVGHGDRRRSA